MPNNYFLITDLFFFYYYHYFVFSLNQYKVTFVLAGIDHLI